MIEKVHTSNQHFLSKKLAFQGLQSFSGFTISPNQFFILQQEQNPNCMMLFVSRLLPSEAGNKKTRKNAVVCISDSLDYKCWHHSTSNQVLTEKMVMSELRMQISIFLWIKDLSQVRPTNKNFSSFKSKLRIEITVKVSIFTQKLQIHSHFGLVKKDRIQLNSSQPVSQRVNLEYLSESTNFYGTFDVKFRLET